MDFMKHMHVEGDNENLWIMLDHVKCLKNWTNMACNVYDSKYCKVLRIVCCNMQSRDGTIDSLIVATQTTMQELLEHKKTMVRVESKYHVIFCGGCQLKLL